MVMVSLCKIVIMQWLLLKGIFMFISEITIWRKLNQKSKEFEHNHIEDSHCQEDVPTPVSEVQKKGWSGAQWQKEFGLLINGVVMHLGSGR